MPYKNPVLAVLTDFAITAQQFYETLRVQVMQRYCCAFHLRYASGRHLPQGR